MGMVWVAFLAASTARVPPATRTSTLRPTSSAMSSGIRYDSLPFDVAQLSKPLPKRLDVMLGHRGSAAESKTNPRDFRLRLCRARERPPCRCAAEKCDELTPPHATPSPRGNAAAAQPNRVINARRLIQNLPPKTFSLPRALVPAGNFDAGPLAPFYWGCKIRRRVEHAQERGVMLGLREV